MPFVGMAYGEFLMVMLAEMVVFAAFAAAGILWRRRPERHRAMMLLASLSILAGATVRMPIFHPSSARSAGRGSSARSSRSA